jgi:hypothetical protein
MFVRTSLLLLLAAACEDVNSGFGVGTKNGPPDTGNGGIDTSITDTTDTDDDQDNDGFSPADGDCDDDDPRVSPARAEEGGDGKDNDCDGKVDEAFAGVSVAWVESSGAGHILVLDSIGRVSDDVSAGACVPFFLDHVVRDGAQLADEWIINDSIASLARVTSDGKCTQIADFSDTEVYEFPPYGVTVTPDGTMYVVLADQLVSVGEDGTVRQLASWNAEEEFYGLGLSNDASSGTVGIFDVYGGLAVYHPDTGFAFLHKPDFMAPELSTLSGAHGDDGAWYVPASSAAGVGVFRFTESSESWVLQDEWDDEDWSPFMMGVDASDPDRPDFYITATAGAYQTVWRVAHGTNHPDQLYVSDGSDFGNFYGIAVRDGAQYSSP